MADVRQSAFALLGDLAKSCAEHLRPVLLQFAGLAAAQLEAAMITPRTMPACNNACWSLGGRTALPGPPLRSACAAAPPRAHPAAGQAGRPGACAVHGVRRARSATACRGPRPAAACPGSLSGRAVRGQSGARACAGELAIKAQPDELAAVAMPVLERLVPILSSPLGHMPRSILENSAITLGRCAHAALRCTQLPPRTAARATALAAGAACGQQGQAHCSRRQACTVSLSSLTLSLCYHAARPPSCSSCTRAAPLASTPVLSWAGQPGPPCRVAWICPEPVAPHLEHFIAPWCAALRSVRDDVEKEHAFLGLAALLRINPLVNPET